jgi:hypothetical protein
MRDPVSCRASERRGRHHGSDQPHHATNTQKDEAAAQSAGVNFECRPRCGVAHRRPLHVRTGRGRQDRRARCFPPCSHPRRRASLSPLNWCLVRPGVAMMSRRVFHLVAQLVQSVDRPTRWSRICRTVAGQRHRWRALISPTCGDGSPQSWLETCSGLARSPDRAKPARHERDGDMVGAQRHHRAG